MDQDKLSVRLVCLVLYVGIPLLMGLTEPYAFESIALKNGYVLHGWMLGALMGLILVLIVRGGIAAFDEFSRGTFR